MAKRDPAKRRIDVVAEKDAESYVDLANAVGLNAFDIALWLQKWKPNAEVKKGDKFTVPNLAIIDVSTYTWGRLGYRLMAHKQEIENRWRASGYFILQTKKTRISIQTMKRHLKDKDLYAYMYVGHGDKGNLTDIRSSTGGKQDLVAGRYTLYMINEFDLIACDSDHNASEWAKNVSVNGEFYGFTNKLRGFNKWIYNKTSGSVSDDLMKKRDAYFKTAEGRKKRGLNPLPMPPELKRFPGE